MTLSRRDYAKDRADPKRSEAAQKGAWKRTMNERTIEKLRDDRVRLIEMLAILVDGWKSVPEDMQVPDSLNDGRFEDAEKLLREFYK